MGNDIAAVTLCETLAIAHARDIYKTKESATSATSHCKTLDHNVLRVHIDFQEMLLEKLPIGVNCQLHIWALLCRNETYRKVRARLFYMSHRVFFMRRRLFKK